MQRDENDVWEFVKKTIKPLKGKSKAIASVPKKKIPVVKSVTPRISAVPVTKPSAKNHLPAKQIKKLRRQEIPVEATLDLHGMTLERAHSALQRFLGRARQNELRCVEVVTGRGNPERGTGQLRRMLPIWLETESGVLHIEENPRTRGGSSLIMLRRTRK